MTVPCTFCGKNDAMLKCRDCEGPGACYSCTVTGPTGGFCAEHLERFMQVHHKTHEAEYEAMDWELNWRGYEEKVKKGKFISKKYLDDASSGVGV